MKSEMHRLRTILLVSLGAVLVLYSLDCFAPGLLDAQSMECCAKMLCTPANQSRDCCKTMATDPSPYLVSAGSSAVAPLVVPVAIIPSVESRLTLPVGQIAEAMFEAKEHAPPLELYTVNHSLLI